jgi:DNA-binding NarL/FixJ family response regulator
LLRDFLFVGNRLGGDVSSSSEITLVVIAPPGRQRDGLRILLQADHKIAVAGEADDLVSGAQVIAQRAPALVVLQGDHDGESFWIQVRQLKNQFSQVHLAVVVPNHRQQELARAAGADAALMEGFTSETMFATIAQMMQTAVMSPA